MISPLADVLPVLVQRNNRYASFISNPNITSNCVPLEGLDFL